MSAISRERQVQDHGPSTVAFLMEPKRRFFACLFVFAIFCVLQHWSWLFSFGAFAAIAFHAGAALFAGDMYCRTLSLESAGVIYHRNDPAFSVALVIHGAILLLFLLTLFLRMAGL